LAEVHDCFSIVEFITYEDLKFCEKGKARELIDAEATTLGGELPVNVSGGLLSSGHPIGATGIRMLYELSLHLRGRADKRQVEDARLGLAHNIGGPGAVSSVTILGAR
ncbi:MAG: thiolase family protein, partial [Thermoplasmata archaeon]|nr:thiolase family protein [Thermoplasmata archaeon]